MAGSDGGLSYMGKPVISDYLTRDLKAWKQAN